MKSRSLAAPLAVAALILAGCSATPAEPTAPSDENPFAVVYIGGITGALASLSGIEVQGLEIAVDELNDAGGILGRTVTLEVIDDKSDPTEAVSVLQKRLTSGTKPDLIRAGLSSSEALAMIPVATRAGIPTFTPAASALLDDPKTYPLTKSITSGFNRATEVIKDYALSKKYKKLTVLVPEDASGDSVYAGAEELYKGSGITLTEARYNPADVDLSVAYQRAIQTDPDAIYVNCLSTACTRIVTARGSVAGGTDIPMLGDTSMASVPGGLGSTLSKDLIENLFVAAYPIQVNDPELQSDDFEDFYSKLTKVAGTPSVVTPPSCAYDGLKMFAAAAEKAKSSDGADMIEAINSIDWKAGAFVSFGNAELKWDAKRTFPTLPDGAVIMVEVSPQVDGLYPPKNVFAG